MPSLPTCYRQIIQTYGCILVKQLDNSMGMIVQHQNAGDAIDTGAGRLPPDEAFVTLSEALSWIAFQHALDGALLAKLVRMGLEPSGNDDDAKADIALSLAVDRLTDLARRGEIKFEGKFYPSVWLDDRDIPIQTISGAALSNYRQFDISGDILWRGRGLAWGPVRNDLPAVTADHYRSVTVKRDDLMRYFAPTTIPEKPRPRKGRTKGSGSLFAADETLFPEIEALIGFNPGYTPNRAALEIADRAAGTGSIESKASRLGKNYRASRRHGDA